MICGLEYFLFFQSAGAPWWQSSTLASWIEAAGVLVQAVLIWWYVRMTGQILKATRDGTVATSQNTELAARAFEAAYRPYVGVLALQLLPPLSRENGTDCAEIRATVKNVGSVPANVERISAWIQIGSSDRESVIMPGNPENAGVLFPHEESQHISRISAERWRAAATESYNITFEMEVLYRGAAERQYRYYSKQAYIHAFGGFMNTNGIAS